MARMLNRHRVMMAVSKKLPFKSDAATNKMLSYITDDPAECYRIGAEEAQNAIMDRIMALPTAGSDPNAPFRWICIHCNTVSGIDDKACVGCRKPRYPKLAATQSDASEKQER